MSPKHENKRSNERSGGIEEGAALGCEIDDNGTKNAGGDTVKSLTRGLGIIQCFDPQHPAWSVAELCDHLGLHMTTACRLVRTLKNTGFLELDAKTGKYHLGPALFSVSYLASSDREVARVAYPYLEKLAAETGETADIAVPVPRGVLFLVRVLTSGPFKPESRVGETIPNYTSAPRKALLAFFPPERKREELERAKALLTPEAWEILVESLKSTVAEGVAQDRGETTAGIYGMAAPVFDATGQARAALGMIAPADRLPPEKKAHCIAELKKTAQLISQRLGYRGPATETEVSF